MRIEKVAMEFEVKKYDGRPADGLERSEAELGVYDFLENSE